MSFRKLFTSCVGGSKHKEKSKSKRNEKIERNEKKEKNEKRPDFVRLRNNLLEHGIENLERPEVIYQNIVKSGNIEGTQNFDQLRNYHLKRGTLFEDPKFAADATVLDVSSRRRQQIKWLRPQEIVENPHFCVDGFSRFDVQQGGLGDCWFLAAAATLTLNANMFARVVPNNQSFRKNYAGIFRFRFWKNGQWIEVVVDDRLPTFKGKLLYEHSSQSNEFWCALLGKAYAKLHGSYEALDDGFASEAMRDFTSGSIEKYELKDKSQNLFAILLKRYENNSMMACSIDSNPKLEKKNKKNKV